MRLNECDEVKKTLAEHLGISLTVVNAGERFLKALEGVVDSEVKRKRIGNLFIECFEEEAIRIEKEAENTPNAGPVKWVSTDLSDSRSCELMLTCYLQFLQGTLYPDVIESISFKGPSATIKVGKYLRGFNGILLINPLTRLTTTLVVSLNA